MDEITRSIIFKKIGFLFSFIFIILVAKFIIVDMMLLPMRSFPHSDFAAELSGYSKEVKGGSEIKYEYRLDENDSIIIRKTDFSRRPISVWQTFPDGVRGYHLIDMVDISRIKNNEVVWQNVAFHPFDQQAPIESNNGYYNKYLNENARMMSSMGIIVRFGGVWPITYEGINTAIKCNSNIIQIGKFSKEVVLKTKTHPEKFDGLEINLDNGYMKRITDRSELCEVIEN